MNENQNLEASNNGILNNQNNNIFNEVSVIQSKEKQIKNKKVVENILLCIFLY